MNLNKVILIGRLTADPLVRTTPAGEHVATIGVATNRSWTDKAGAKKESTEFHNVVVWGRQAEIVSQFLTKGGTILIEGRLQTRSFEGKDGVSRKTTEIVAERVQLGPRQGGSGSGGFAPEGRGGAFPDEASDTKVEDIPTIHLDEEGIKPEDLPF